MPTYVLSDPELDYVVITNDRSNIPKDAREIDPEAMTDQLLDDDELAFAEFEYSDGPTITYIRSEYSVKDI